MGLIMLRMLKKLLKTVAKFDKAASWVMTVMFQVTGQAASSLVGRNFLFVPSVSRFSDMSRTRT